MRPLARFLRSPLRVLLASISTALLVIACVETIRPGVIVSLTVTPNPVGLTVGSRMQLAAAARDAQGQPVEGAVVTWSTSNESVAAVSGTGEVEARDAGSATITARSGEASGTSGVTVTAAAAPVASVSVSPASVTVERGSTVQLTATVRDAAGNVLSDRAVSWASSNTGSATVSGSGLVTAVAAGNASITATSEGKGGSSAVSVTEPAPPPPAPVASVTVTPSSATVERGATVQLTATLRDASGNVLSGRAVSWASSNTAAATVSGSGLVTGVAAGSATITATSESKSGASAVTVTEPPPPPPPPPGGSATLIAAGDIAYCDEDGDEQTAALLDNMPGTIITLGDMAYDDGTLSEFQTCYEPSWGRHKARTRPSPGNHEYHTSNAQGYFDYFGAAAGEVGKGFYSFDLGDWHIISLNYYVDRGSSSPQITWLKADLAANTKKCTLAFWHRPRFSSGHHGSSTSPNGFVQPLYDAGADVVLVSHDHIYERFARMRPDGTADPVRGIRHFTVGTGGAPLTSIGTPVANSEVRSNGAHGVLKLTLRADGYDWQFVPVAGKTFTDSGSGTCH